MKKNKFPNEWDEEKTRNVISFYERQIEVEAIAEDETAFANQSETRYRSPKRIIAHHP